MPWATRRVPPSEVRSWSPDSRSWRLVLPRSPRVCHLRHPLHGRSELSQLRCVSESFRLRHSRTLRVDSYSTGVSSSGRTRFMGTSPSVGPPQRVRSGVTSCDSYCDVQFSAAAAHRTARHSSRVTYCTSAVRDSVSQTPGHRTHLLRRVLESLRHVVKNKTPCRCLSDSCTTGSESRDLTTCLHSPELGYTCLDHDRDIMVSCTLSLAVRETPGIVSSGPHSERGVPPWGDPPPSGVGP